MAQLRWGEVEKAAAESKKQRGNKSRRFVIQDGETAMVRFLVNPNEPFIYKRHFANNAGRNGRYLVCAEDKAREGKHSGCVVCAVARSQGKGGNVRLASRVYGFSVLDPRKYHRVEEGKDVSYELCSEDARCRWCRKGNESKATGVCHWTLAEAVALQLKTFEHDLLGEKCAICQVGRIKVVEYVCPDCGEIVEPEDGTTEVRCFNCNPKKVVMVMPQEVVKCSKGCKGARRTTLADAWVAVTRSGSGTSTTYNFAPGEIGPMPKEWEDAEPINFEEIGEFQPETATEQAVILQVKNPFKDAPADDDDEENDDQQEGMEVRAPTGNIFKR